MPKAYIISRVDVHDAEAYGRYAALATVAMKKYACARRALEGAGRRGPVAQCPRRRLRHLKFFGADF
jgi:hypothetical protein